LISLPQGVTVNYPVKIIIDQLSIEIFTWFRDIGGKVWVETKPFDRRGIAREEPMVQYGNSKPCYYLQDGSSNVMLNFNGKDASVATMFLLRFDTHVVSHNLREADKYVY
jgi:hypothetical protein